MNTLLDAIRTMWGAVQDDALLLILVLLAIAGLRCLAARLGKE
jgi:hypothetical protein